jgi:hypothetical protein
VRQVGYSQGLNRDARSTEHKIRLIMFLMIENDVHGVAKFSENVTDLRSLPPN